MGIYDREYLRDESSGSGLFGGISPVTKSLIAIHVIAFLLLQLLLHDQGRTASRWLAASPDWTLGHHRYFQLLTASFVSTQPIALLFDMIFFWFMGREMEARYGSPEFLLFYLGAAVLTTAAGLLVAASVGPALAMLPIAGPWGAILAVMTLYTLYYPRQEILFFFIIPMPMWVLLTIFMVLPFLGFFGGNSPGIDLAIVLAGAGYAYAYKQVDWRWTQLIPARRFRPRLRIFTGSSAKEGARAKGWSPSRPSTAAGGGRAPSVSVLPEDQLDARVDEILAKIARDGRESLSDDEQRILQEASRRARMRRSDRI